MQRSSCWHAWKVPLFLTVARLFLQWTDRIFCWTASVICCNPNPKSRSAAGGPQRRRAFIELLVQPKQYGIAFARGLPKALAVHKRHMPAAVLNQAASL